MGKHNPQIDRSRSSVILTLWALLGAAATVSAEGCLGSDARRCSWGVVCPPGRVCHAPTQECARPVRIEACDGVPELAPCSFEGSGPSFRCRLGICVEPFCGDGVVDPLEACDDGNTEENDGCSDRCRTETPVWEQVSAGDGPQRNIAAMVCDTFRERLVLFGGVTLDASAVSVYRGETWEYDGKAWVEMSPAVSPQPRASQAMAYDAARGRVVLFGGGADRLIHFGDTWEYDGETWTETSPGVSPVRRWASAMAYDEERERIVLFGGAFSLEQYGDTWEYDGQTWTEVTPDPSPSPRQFHAMVYDPVRGNVVLFGGSALEGDKADTWVYDGANWMEITPEVCPSPRSTHSMTYHPGTGNIVLLGGLTREGATQYAVLGDQWEFDGDAWFEADPPRRPQARAAAAIAPFFAHKAAILVGGSDGFGIFSDTWALVYRDLASCGNGFLDPGEGCDGGDFGGLSCYLLGFTGGTLTCTQECRVALEACYICGDGVREPGESCDGTDLGGQTCEDLGFSGGQLGCDAQCNLDLAGCAS